MDLRELDLSQWRQLTTTIWFLWLWAPLVVTFALSLWVALAVIPSFVTTGHLPQRTMGLRPIFFIVAFAALLAAFASLANALMTSQVLSDIYRRWLI